MMRIIDLRSDTVTLPTPEMRQAMATCPVGDDVFEDDPTTLRLETLAANMMKKEAALFVPSGTFSNQLALFTHAGRGDEVIVDQNCHIDIHESGASAIIAGVQLFTLESDNGIWDLEKLKRVIKEQSMFTPGTRLICMENAYNGRVLPLEYMRRVHEIALSRGIPVHIDGARIFNAATFLGCDVSEIAACAETVSVCLSKGLCSPVGTVLVGSKAFIEAARRKRKIMGGGMRQTGILAACGIISLEKMSKRLGEDHENARILAKGLSEIPGLTIDEKQRDINLVFFDIDDPRKARLHEFLAEKGVKTLPWEQGFRFVTHHDVTREDVFAVIGWMKEYFCAV
jgi:threonine aldolase